MRAIVERDLFYKMLHKAVQARKKSKTLPMSNYVKLVVNADKISGVIHIQTHDANNYFSCYLGADECQEGTAIIDCQTLLNIVKVAKDKISLSITLDNMNTLLKIESDGCSYTLHSQQDETNFFKEPKVGKNLASIQTDGKDLREMISRVFYASGMSDTRYTLNSVPFLFREDKLILVGTDGHRMAVLTKDIKTTVNYPERRNFIAPRRWLTALLQIVKICDRAPIIVFTDNHVILTCGNVTLISRLVEGTYPNYETVIPKESTTTAIFKKVDMLRAISKFRAIPLSRKSYATKLSASNLGWELNASLLGDYSAEMTIPIQKLIGDPHTFGLNISYLHEALIKCKGQVVSLEMRGQLDSMRLTEFETNDSGEIYEAVLMPMKLY
jgi:DNA polymerase-3 subunit beta